MPTVETKGIVCKAHESNRVNPEYSKDSQPGGGVSLFHSLDRYLRSISTQTSLEHLPRASLLQNPGLMSLKRQ
jgi:hypothetical protein